MFGSLIDRMRGTAITLGDWFFGFLSIFFVRFLLENISSPPLNGVIASDFPTIIHVGFFFAGVIVSLLVVFRLIFKDHEDAEKLILFGFPVIWIAPILDLVISGGKGYFMGYPLRDSFAGIIQVFWSFWSGDFILGITPGIRIEIFLVMLGSALFAFYKTKSFLKTGLVAASSYVVVFLWAEALSIIKIVHDAVLGGSGTTTLKFFTDSFNSSLSAANFLHPTIHLSYSRTLEIISAVVISQMYYILILFLLALYFYLTRRAKLACILKNSRPLRVGYYYAMVVIGFFLSGEASSFAKELDWTGAISLAVLFLAYYCAWMFAVGLNDIADIEVDKISNPSRPLARGDLSLADMKSANLFFLTFALLGGYLSGHYVFFMISVALSASYVYSSPPFRLRTWYFLSSFLVAIASFSAVLSGFFFLSGDKTLRAFPVYDFFFIITALVLLVNLKDVKDIEGDRAAGIETIPVVFGEKTGKRIVGLLTGLAFLLAPAFFRSRALLWPSLISAALAYFFINRRPYREWMLFLLGFLYLISVLVLV